VLRAVIMNSMTDMKILNEVLYEQKEIAKQILQSPSVLIG